MATKTKEPKVEDGQKLLARIGEQHRMIEDMREQHQRDMRLATRRLAELIAETADHPDAGVNFSSAARAMGTVRSYTQALVRKLRAGELDG